MRKMPSSLKLNRKRRRSQNVREKSKALKLYIDRKLDASGYDSRAKAKINTVIDSNAEDFNVIEKATPYDEIITLKNILAGVGKRKLFK